MLEVFTVGYEGIDLNAFLGLLKANRIDLVADVRDLPLSRKKGFSKTPLKAALETQGIFYRHFRELGAPKHLRHQLRAGGGWGAYEAGYRSLLKERVGAIEELGLLLKEYRVCLLCFEEDPTTCHRSLIAQALVETGWAEGARDLRKGAFIGPSVLGLSGHPCLFPGAP
ncbi:DUF488 domain-containing protein [Thermus brockianus]